MRRWVFCFIMLWLGYKAFDPVPSFPSWGSRLPDPATPEGTCPFLEIFAIYLLFWRPLIQSDRGLRLKSFCLASNFASTTSEMPRPSLSPVLPVFSCRQCGRDVPGQAGGGKAGGLAHPAPTRLLAHFQACRPSTTETGAGRSLSISLHAAALLTSVLPEGRGRPSGRRAPTTLRAQAGAPRPSPGEEPRPPSARRLGRPGPPPGAQRHPPESRFAPLWALGSGTGARRDWGPGAVLPRASSGRCRGARC